MVARTDPLACRPSPRIPRFGHRGDGHGPALATARDPKVQEVRLKGQAVVDAASKRQSADSSG